MAVLVKDQLFKGIYQGRRVLVTGHTGFKGSWLVSWLKLLGANTAGLSLAPDSAPNHYELLPAPNVSVFADILDAKQVDRLISEFKPEIIFHLAAQPLVRESYRDPVNTVATNVLGLVNVLESARQQTETRAFVNVTTDKCYENLELGTPYVESDRLGGYDPYSASKACSEIMTTSYRQSYPGSMLIASARAGNVIGGGDWAEDRLIPDVVRATQEHNPVAIRQPQATRPWQHVLEPLSGYLLLGQQLLEGKKEFADSWNFGPETELNLSVQNLLESLSAYMPLEFKIEPEGKTLHEAQLLMLDCSKAKKNLAWKPILDKSETLSMTASWYQSYYENGACDTQKQLEEYINLAVKREASWV